MTWKKNHDIIDARRNKNSKIMVYLNFLPNFQPTILVLNIRHYSIITWRELSGYHGCLKIIMPI